MFWKMAYFREKVILLCIFTRCGLFAQIWLVVSFDGLLYDSKVDGFQVARNLNFRPNSITRAGCGIASCKMVDIVVITWIL